MDNSQLVTGENFCSNWTESQYIFRVHWFTAGNIDCNQIEFMLITSGENHDSWYLLDFAMASGEVNIFSSKAEGS